MPNEIKNNVWQVADENVTADHLGMIPYWVANAAPEKSAVEAIDRNYAHGGGWHDFKGFTLEGGGDAPYTLEFAGDPSTHEYAHVTRDNGEVVIVFKHSWVCVVAKDGTYRIARID